VARIIDLTGKRFARWTVNGLSHQVDKMLYWHCVCECGTKRAVFGGDLKRGGSLSCGCLTRERSSARLATHRMTTHPAYSSWKHMKTRCTNHKDRNYRLYGGRGVRLCERWLSFEKFWEDMGPTWLSGASIDRIDTNGDYAPENCRWATPLQQAGNRRTQRLINTPDGPMSVTEAAKLFGLTRNTIFARIRYGWPEHRLLMPLRTP
jgi:hypothetical protein